ncbi:28S ribosomal protein S6, mitochondrial isoform X1 [Chiroxiphia lanceolata]|uniref:28S ribosomal protein S6, mitochondrial isoform X1 n=1 Tax=Chiroxiphia lanceolata TaxID=296741 RepID=UPI0013CE4212|nr:28S ribosomal protein S6, mitochondrial isoform X1 [Chiroxiphia lanceolata]
MTAEVPPQAAATGHRSVNRVGFVLFPLPTAPGTHKAPDKQQHCHGNAPSRCRDRWNSPKEPLTDPCAGTQPETAAVLKRTVEALMERGAVVRKLENLGERALPYKISKHSERHRRGWYFLIDLEAPPSIVSAMTEHLGRDIDVIRQGFVKHPLAKPEECPGMVPVNYEDKLSGRKK